MKAKNTGQLVKELKLEQVVIYKMSNSVRPRHVQHVEAG